LTIVLTMNLISTLTVICFIYCTYHQETKCVLVNREPRENIWMYHCNCVDSIRWTNYLQSLSSTVVGDIKFIKHVKLYVRKYDSSILFKPYFLMYEPIHHQHINTKLLTHQATACILFSQKLTIYWYCCL